MSLKCTISYCLKIVTEFTSPALKISAYCQHRKQSGSNFLCRVLYRRNKHQIRPVLSGGFQAQYRSQLSNTNMHLKMLDIASNLDRDKYKKDFFSFIFELNSPRLNYMTDRYIACVQFRVQQIVVFLFIANSVYSAFLLLTICMHARTHAHTQREEANYIYNI